MQAVIYARISTQIQNDGASLESQILACREYAAANQFTVTREAQEVFSGIYLFDRPILNEIREEIRAGKYQALIVFDVDRLSRNVPHLGILLDECLRFNTQLIFVKNDFENSPEGMLLFSIRGYLAEAERLKIIERTTRGRRTKAKNGTLSFKRKLFGYYLDESGQRQIYEPEAAEVRWAFEAYANGDSLRLIASKMNERGVSTPKGGVWWAFSLHDLLTNPAYVGRTVIFRQRKETRFVQGKRILTTIRTEAHEQTELPKGITPPIVSEEVFETVQMLLKKNKQEKRARPKHDFLLRGMIKCETCGRKMSPQISRGFRSYVCNSRQNPAISCKTKACKANEAEKLVWAEVERLYRNPKKINQIIKASKRDNPRTQQKIAEDAIKKKEKEIETLISRAESVSNQTWEVFRQRIEIKQTELNNLRLKASIISQDVEALVQKELDAENFLALALQILPELDNPTFEQKVNMCRALDMEVVWNGQDLQLFIGEKQYYGKSNFNGYFNNTAHLPKTRVLTVTV